MTHHEILQAELTGYGFYNQSEDDEVIICPACGKTVDELKTCHNPICEQQACENCMVKHGDYDYYCDTSGQEDTKRSECIDKILKVLESVEKRLKGKE